MEIGYITQKNSQPDDITQVFVREMEKYLKLLGNVNLRMGEMADLVTEVVYGIPVERKDIKK